MAGSCSEGLSDDFFEQILAVPESAVVGYGSGRNNNNTNTMGVSTGRGGGGMPLGLNLEQTGFVNHRQHPHPTHFLEGGGSSITNDHQHLRLHHNNTVSSPPSSTAEIRDCSMMMMQQQQQQMRGDLFSPFGQMHTPTHAQPVRPTLTSSPQPQLHHQYLQQQQFQSQSGNSTSVATHTTMPQAAGIRPRVRARRGQATDPHSIAERLRRERIAERMRALQELVPGINKTDKAVMLDEIVDYVKFLRLQVKVLSMSRLGGAGAVAQLVADVPASAVEGGDIEGIGNQEAWAKWSTDGTEEQVAKLMEEDVGAAMQFLQSKALCIMPISLASAIFRMPQSEAPVIKPE